MEGGNIRVGICFTESTPAITPDYVDIKVSDTGKGIPEKNMN